MLVLTINGPSAWRNARAIQRMETEFAREMCREQIGEAFFQSGKTLRMDTLEDGAGLREGSVVHRCPTR
jgi:hypothetical protein